MSVATVVANRVDALTLAYRVTIAPDVLDELRKRHEVAKEHGRAACRAGALAGELRFTRSGSCWNIRNGDMYARIDLKAPGAVDGPDGKRKEAGWTVEIVWLAQALARVPLDEAIRCTRKIADTLGDVHEERVRRIDLCADVAGWKLDPEQKTRLLKRSAAKLTEYPLEGDWRLADATLYERSRITGFGVGMGGAITGRIYDKREELARKEGPREAEEARWKAGSWDGEAPVTRVEFQIRGEAIRDLGARDPNQPYDPTTGEVFGGLHQIIDRIWQKCLWWMRLVRRDNERLTRCSDDPRWALLRYVTFVRKTVVEHGRRRVRGGATAEQALGCVLSILAGKGLLKKCPKEDKPRMPDAIVAAALYEEVDGAFRGASALVAEKLIAKWGAAKGAQHLAILTNATVARFEENAHRQRWLKAILEKAEMVRATSCVAAA